MNKTFPFTWGAPGKASVLVGGQFGSEGKGLIAAYLAQAHAFDICTTNAGAQAGHTTKFRICDGTYPAEFVLRHLPTAGVMTPGAQIFLNAGSIIMPSVLEDEIRTHIKEDVRNRLAIHPNAAVITAEDLERELGDGLTARIGSTSKGVGAALVRKIQRTAKLACQTSSLMKYCARMSLNHHMNVERKSVMVEIPQGTGLSINHGYLYPQTTSRDCHIGAGLSDAGIHPSFVRDICMVVRSFPIRVGGNSGPFYIDSEELNWAKRFPKIEPERTTVTQRVRRIATWSNLQYRDALQLNRPTVVALTFCDYFESPGDFRFRVQQMVAAEQNIGLHPAHIYSFSPYVEDVTVDPDKVCDVINRGM